MFAAGPQEPGTVDRILDAINDFRRQRLSEAVKNPKTPLSELRTLRKNVTEIHRWNDDPQRSKSDVMHVLERAGV